MTAIAFAPRWRPTVILLAALDEIRRQGDATAPGTEDLVVRLFESEGRSLVRLARLFVDDRDAAEDLVQEAFLRLARHRGDIQQLDRAPAYLRSIVLNLARDHNRRGLVSLRHQASAASEAGAGVVQDEAGELVDRLARDAEHVRVLDAVRDLPRRQRDCVTLRYFEEMSIEAVASTLGLSPNSVKTHLRRGIEQLGRLLAPDGDGAGSRRGRRR